MLSHLLLGQLAEQLELLRMPKEVRLVNGHRRDESLPQLFIAQRRQLGAPARRRAPVRGCNGQGPGEVGLGRCANREAIMAAHPGGETFDILRARRGMLSLRGGHRQRSASSCSSADGGSSWSGAKT